MSVDIPNYRIVEKLGEGAQSRLYRARCMRTGKDYTVKIVKVVRPEDMSILELLKAEHAIGTAVDHPVIRKIFEIRIMRQRLRVRGGILFMEYVGGMTMSEKEFDRPLADVVRLFRSVAEGLHAMHLAGFVHADLKPSNILVNEDGLVKLIDLGQSCKIREAKPRIQGTIDYIAPEQVQRGVLDQRTDVFGLGAALHRVVTGKPVATEMNQTVSMNSPSLIGKRVSEIKHETTDDLPTCVARLIDDCCQYDPKNRLSDMAVVMQRLELAQTILEKQSTGARLEPQEVPIADPSADSHAGDLLDDAILEELGLTGERDDSVDLDDDLNLE